MEGNTPCSLLVVSQGLVAPVLVSRSLTSRAGEGPKTCPFVQSRLHSTLRRKHLSKQGEPDERSWEDWHKPSRRPHTDSRKIDLSVAW